MNRRRDVVHVGHQVVVLRDRKGDAGDIGLLESVGADQRAADLAGDAQDGRRIQHRRGDPGHHVRRAGSGGRDRHPHVPARPGVAVRHVGCALFVPHEDVAHRVVQHGVVRRQDGSARIPEHRVHTLLEEGLPDELRAGSPPGFGHRAFCGRPPGVMAKWRCPPESGAASRHFISEGVANTCRDSLSFGGAE